MFSITRKQIDGFELIELKENATGTFADIAPSLGATLHSFCTMHQKATVNIIDFYTSAADFQEHVAAKGFKSCKLSPFACRMKDASYTLQGQTYTVEKYVLNGSALHGLLYDAPFTISNENVTNDSASVTLTYQYKAADRGYPFHYTCSVSYTLKAQNQLVLTTNIINNGLSVIPVQDGWHPYFCFGKSIDALQLEFQSAAHVLFDEKLLPTGQTQPYETYSALKKIGGTFFDDCFSLNFDTCQPMCVLRDPELGIQLEIRPDKSYPYLQIYTPPHRTSIAIENLSAPPDAFNNGISLVHLEPGANAVFTTSYTITSLK